VTVAATAVGIGAILLGAGLTRSRPVGSPPAVVGTATSTAGSAATRPSYTVGPPPAVLPTARVAPAARHAFPVRGSFSYERTHHGYPAADIIAPCGTPVVAAYDGVILEVERVDRYVPRVNAGATRGGLSVSLLGADGVRYYGSHFSSIDEAVRPGLQVRAGDRLGKVGRTGDAGACHLHFGLSPICARTGDWWTRRGVIWPWPYLDSWREHADKSPAAEVKAWQAANGCPRTPRVEP
jgi:murein DD-endopeptidase MepM/ murein hydrolase activator NlpD